VIGLCTGACGGPCTGLRLGLNAGCCSNAQATTPTFVFAGTAASKPGQLYLVGDDGTPAWRSYQAAPWRGQYNTFENGGAGTTAQGLHEWLRTPSGAGAQCTVLQGEAGWFQNPCLMETGSTNTGSCSIVLGSANSWSVSANSGVVTYEGTFGIPALSNGTDRFAITAGFLNTSNGFAATNGVFLRYRDDNNGGRFEFVSIANNVSTLVDTAIAPTAGSYYHVKVEIVNNTLGRAWIKTIYDAAGAATFTDDGVWGAAPFTSSTNVPSGSGQSFLATISIVKSVGTTTKTMKVGYNRAWRTPTFAGNPAVAGDVGTCLRIDETGSPAWMPPHRITHPIVFYALARGGFIPSVSADMGAEAVSTGSATATAVDNGYMGVTTLNTGAGAGGGEFYRTAYNLNIDAAVQPMVIEGVFDIPTLSTGVETFLFQIGLFDQVSSAHNNGITIELDSNSSTHAIARCVSGGVSTTVDTGVVIAAGTQYCARIVITSTNVSFYLKQDGAASFGAAVATITTNIPTGTKNMAAGLGVRKSAGTTNRSGRYVYCLAYQRSSTWTPVAASKSTINLQVVAAGYGRTRSAGNGTYDQGDFVMIEDDNSNTGITPVATFGVVNPRTHLWALQQSAHMNIWGSSDLLASGDWSGFDDTHPNCWTLGTTGSPGHVGAGNGGATPIVVFSANSHTRTCDVVFRIPTLSNGTNTFNSRFGWASALFGTVTNGIFAEVDSNTNGNMQFVTRQASTETRTDSGITILANTWYRLRIIVTRNTTVDYYLATEANGLPATPTKTNTTNIPSGTGQACLDNFLVESTLGTSSLPMQSYVVSMDRFAS
jgi:hypothetical protein